MSPPKETSLPIFACPDCHENLELTVERNLICHSFSTEYEGNDGIAQLVGSKSKINFSELQSNKGFRTPISAQELETEF